MKKIAADRNYRMLVKLSDEREFRRISDEDIREGLEHYKEFNPWECEGCTDEEWFQKAKAYALRYGHVFEYIGM